MSARRSVLPDAVRELARVVQIRDVRLMEVQGSVGDARGDDRGGDHRITLQIGADRSETDELFAFVNIEVVATAEADPKRVLARLKAVYAVRYQLPADRLKALSQEDAELFAGFNGVYNVWPYARELFQTTTAKMLLPAVVLPVYRPGMFGPPKEWVAEPPSSPAPAPSTS